MKAIIKNITAMVVSAMMIGGSAVSVYAEESISKEEIIDELYEQYWADSAVGTENPEGSLEYHILTDWLEENYEKPERESGVWRWYVMYDIQHAYRKYYNEYTAEWYYNDDEDTHEFTIEDLETEETLYRFELIDGMWNMIDMNGNTVDVFEPHGGDGSWEAIKNGDGDEERMDNLLQQMGGNGESKDDEPQTDDEPEHEANYMEADKMEPDVAGEEEATDKIANEKPAAGAEEENRAENNAAASADEGKPDKGKPDVAENTEKSSPVLPIAASVGAAALVAGIAVFVKKKGGTK